MGGTSLALIESILICPIERLKIILITKESKNILKKKFN